MAMRKLPPMATPADRQQAAHLEADKLCAILREQALMVELWSEQDGGWEHFISSDGAVNSEWYRKQ